MSLLKLFALCSVTVLSIVVVFYLLHGTGSNTSANSPSIQNNLLAPECLHSVMDASTSTDATWRSFIVPSANGIPTFSLQYPGTFQTPKTSVAYGQLNLVFGQETVSEQFCSALIIEPISLSPGQSLDAYVASQLKLPESEVTTSEFAVNNHRIVHRSVRVESPVIDGYDAYYVQLSDSLVAEFLFSLTELNIGENPLTKYAAISRNMMQTVEFLGTTTASASATATSTVSFSGSVRT